MTAPAQLEFPSLQFPGRNSLRPQEIAERLQITTQHVFDLIEEGKIRAVNIAGANNISDRRYLRIPVEAWETFIRDSIV